MTDGEGDAGCVGESRKVRGVPVDEGEGGWGGEMQDGEGEAGSVCE